MSSIAAWFARNSVAANLLMVFLVVAGAVAAATIKIELFPDFSLDIVTVRVPYPGAAPEEVEEAICIPIEEEIHSIEGVEKITSTAVEGMGTVNVEVASGEDPRRVLDDVKTLVDAIDSFPELSEQPVIEEIVLKNQVINVAVFGPADERTLKSIAEEARDEINRLDGISQVEVTSVRPYEISIEVSEEELRRLGLSFDEVATAVRQSSVDLSGGSVKTEGGEILVRTKGKAYTGDEFSRIVLRSEADGTRVLLSDVARVVDGFEDTDQSARFNGQPLAMIQVFRVGDENALEVASAVHAYIERVRPTLPEGVGIAPWHDQSILLRDRLELLLRNGAQGLVLVFVVLALFLRFRLSLWVTLGIPISFLGVLAVMPGTGQSINLLSLFAFILVLGIVVDDAIVVGENVYRENEQGHGGVEGAVRGVRGVAVPVVFAVLTTIVAFVPIVYLPGLMGKFFAAIPLAVIPALGFSLIESQLILPAHLAHGGGLFHRLASVPPFRWWIALQTRVSSSMVWFAENVYRRILELALQWRYATLAIGLATLMGTLGLVRGGFVEFVFFPDIEGDVLTATLRMPQGTAVEGTSRAVRQLEEAAQRLEAELAAEGHGDVIVNFMASIGEQPFQAEKQRYGGQAGGGTSASHLAEVVLELVSAEERDITSKEIGARWRELCGPIPGATELSFDAAIMSAGKPIDIQLAGQDVDELRTAAEEIKSTLTAIPGVLDVADSFRGGKSEVVLDIRPAGEALGLTRRDLARQVRQALHGEEAQSIQRGRDEVKVMVRLPEEDRKSLSGIESLRIRTPDGREVPFPTVARVSRGRGYATIQRTDRMRTINITADVDTNVANANLILDSLAEERLPGIMDHRPGTSWSFEGQRNEQVETLTTMVRLYLIAFFVIYALMAIPFRSYVQPLIVMTAIPFGLVGAILGHLIMGHDLSMLSLLGIAALAGVVVNDSLVLVDFVNRRRLEGADVLEAARESGVRRFRPIILTSLTTFVGLLPLILERSFQAQFLIPMALSLAFGVLFSTVISLVLVPSAYLMLDDAKRALRWIYGAPPQRVPDPGPVESA